MGIIIFDRKWSVKKSRNNSDEKIHICRKLYRICSNQRNFRSKHVDWFLCGLRHSQLKCQKFILEEPWYIKVTYDCMFYFSFTFYPLHIHFSCCNDRDHMVARFTSIYSVYKSLSITTRVMSLPRTHIDLAFQSFDFERHLMKVIPETLRVH